MPIRSRAGIAGAPFVLAILIAAADARALQPGSPGVSKPSSVLLEDLTWNEAEKVLTPDAVVVIPVGAAAKEHGPHLRLKNDFVLAEYFKRRLMSRSPVVVASRGTWGDPTLATREKGRRVVEAMVDGMAAEVESLRIAAPPARPPGEPRLPGGQTRDPLRTRISPHPPHPLRARSAASGRAGPTRSQAPGARSPSRRPARTAPGLRRVWDGRPQP